MALRNKLNVRLLVVGVMVGVLLIAGISPARQALEQRHRIAATKARLATLEKENAALDERLSRLQDPDYMEKLAREELGLVKEGETAYVVVPPPPSTETVTAPKPKSKSLPEKAWDWITGIFE